jgi:hypothetical protein
MADYILAVRKIDQENDASLKSRVFNLVKNIACSIDTSGIENTPEFADLPLLAMMRS